MANKVKRLGITLELKHVTLAQSGIYTCGANSTIDLKTHDIAVNIRDTQGPDLNARAYDWFCFSLSTKWRLFIVYQPYR